MNGLPIGGSSALVTMRQMSGKFAKEKHDQARPKQRGTADEEDNTGQNAAEELTKVLASTELNANESELCNTSTAEVLTTQDSTMLESEGPPAAVMQDTRTTGASAQSIEKGQDLTVNELEEMLRKKRNEDKKNPGKTDNKEKKTMRTRSTSLRRNTENK